jgi:hypothetical protein
LRWQAKTSPSQSTGKQLHCRQPQPQRPSCIGYANVCQKEKSQREEEKEECEALYFLVLPAISLFGNMAMGCGSRTYDLGRTLASELRLFRHVTGAHKFKDAYLFYQLRRDDDSTISSIENASDVSSNANSESVELLVEAFKQCVDVRDRKYRLKTHKQCFIGCGKNLFFLELRNLRRYMSSQRLVQYTHLAFCFQMS